MGSRGVAVSCGTIAVVIGLALGGASALAHHIEVNEFDRSKAVTLTGEVVRVEWINPHPWIHIRVAGDDGRAERWMVEAAAPMNLLRRGFSPDSISPGTLITVEGYQSKHGTPLASGHTLTYADGSRFYIGYLGLTGTAESGN